MFTISQVIFTRQSTLPLCQPQVHKRREEQDLETITNETDNNNQRLSEFQCSIIFNDNHKTVKYLARNN